MRELTISRYTSTRRKPGPTAKARAKRKLTDAKYAKLIRAVCVERDGYCRYGGKAGDQIACAGPSEWAHLGDKTRAKTRGMAPEARHTTRDSLMLCKAHHDAYDGRRRPRLLIEMAGSCGADGPVYFEEWPCK